MSGTTGRRQDLGDKLATQPLAPRAAPDRLTGWLARSAVAGIIITVAVMIAASAVHLAYREGTRLDRWLTSIL